MRRLASSMVAVAALAGCSGDDTAASGAGASSSTSTSASGGTGGGSGGGEVGGAGDSDGTAFTISSASISDITALEGDALVAGARGEAPWMAAVTLDGELLWELVGDAPFASHASQAVVVPGGDIAAVGVLRDAPPFDTQRAFAARFTSSGAPLWQVELQGLSGGASGVAPFGDGVVIAALGHVGVLDGDGNPSWWRTPDTGTFSRVVPTGDGGVAVLGATSAPSANYVVWLVKLDATGTLVWQRAFEAPGWGFASDIVAVDDGFAISALVQSNPSAQYDGVVARLDSTGALLWQRGISRLPAHAQAFGVGVAADSGVALVGFSDDAISGDRDITVATFGPDGETRAVRTFGLGHLDMAASVDVTSSGRILVAGATDGLPAGGTSAWVIAADANADVGGCDTEIVTPASEEIMIKDDLLTEITVDVALAAATITTVPVVALSSAATPSTTSVQCTGQ